MLGHVWLQRTPARAEYQDILYLGPAQNNNKYFMVMSIVRLISTLASEKEAVSPKLDEFCYLLVPQARRDVP